MNYRQNLWLWAVASCLGTYYLLTSELPAYAGKSLSCDSSHESGKTFRSSFHSEASNDVILSLDSDSALLHYPSPKVVLDEASGFEMPLHAKALSNAYPNRNDSSLQPAELRRPPTTPSPRRSRGRPPRK